VYAEVSIPSVREAFLELAQRAFAEEAPGRVAWAIFNFVRELLKAKKARVAVLADDVFQAIGLSQAAGYIKGLLNTIEHPLYSYERMVVIVATSEGVSRREIGRHRWASSCPCGTWAGRASSSCTGRYRSRSPASRKRGG
jgi:hypothetical protein